MHWLGLRLRFGLNRLLMTVTLCAVALGWIANKRVEYRDEQQILAELNNTQIITAGSWHQLFAVDES